MPDPSLAAKLQLYFAVALTPFVGVSEGVVGHVIAGGAASVTVIVKPHDEESPVESVAVHVIDVAPTLYAIPDAFVQDVDAIGFVVALTVGPA